MTSEAFRALLASVPEDFADPAADYLQVRSTMAPFHNHPTSPDLRIDIREVGGVRCG